MKEKCDNTSFSIGVVECCSTCSAETSENFEISICDCVRDYAASYDWIFMPYFVAGTRESAFTFSLITT